MKQIVETNKGPKEQISSMGCSIKWINKLMYLIVTRSFPPEIGGMQNLMWGLTNEVI